MSVKYFYNKFRKRNVNKIRNLRTTNPKKYWKILNGKKKKKKKKILKQLWKLFFDFFSKSNFDENSNEETPNNNGNIDFNPNETFSYNDPINEAEITEAIKKLKNNKSPGIDLILNEHLKSTSDTLLPVLKNLFNLVFETGIIPEI